MRRGHRGRCRRPSGPSPPAPPGVWTASRREGGQQRATEHRADPRDAAQQLVVDAPRRAGGPLVEIAVDPLDVHTSHRRCDSTSRRTSAAPSEPVALMVRMPKSWRRWSSKASSSRAAASGRDWARRGPPRTGPARASMGSVLASPRERAKWRAWRGLKTSTGKPARRRAAAAACSRPPVASSTSRRGARGSEGPARRDTRECWERRRRGVAGGDVEPVLETSMPTNVSGYAAAWERDLEGDERGPLRCGGDRETRSGTGKARRRPSSSRSVG